MRHSSPVTLPPATLQREKGHERTTRSGLSLAPYSKQFMLKDKDRKSIFKSAELVARVLSCEVRIEYGERTKLLLHAHVTDEVCQHRKLLQISKFTCLLEGPVEADRHFRIAAIISSIHKLGQFCDRSKP